jgi:hypothetical protein
VSISGFRVTCNRENVNSVQLKQVSDTHGNAASNMAVEEQTLSVQWQTGKP